MCWGQKPFISSNSHTFLFLITEFLERILDRSLGDLWVLCHPISLYPVWTNHRLFWWVPTDTSNPLIWTYPESSWSSCGYAITQIPHAHFLRYPQGHAPLLGTQIWMCCSCGKEITSKISHLQTFGGKFHHSLYYLIFINNQYICLLHCIVQDNKLSLSWRSHQHTYLHIQPKKRSNH